jgi:hypothetical protein
LETQRRPASVQARAVVAEEIVPFEVNGRKPFTLDTN